MRKKLLNQWRDRNFPRLRTWRITIWWTYSAIWNIRNITEMAQRYIWSSPKCTTQRKSIGCFPTSVTQNSAWFLWIEKWPRMAFIRNFVLQNQMEVKFLCNSLQVWTVISNDGSSYRRLTEVLKIWMTCSCVNGFFCVVQKIGIILQWEDFGVDSRYDAIYGPICRGKNYDFLIDHTETDFRRKTNKRNTNIQYNRTKAVTVWSYECGKYGHKWFNCNYW